VAVTPGRRAALAALRASGRGRRLDLALASALAQELTQGKVREPERERRFAHELAYGTVRLRGRLDHLIAAQIDRPLAAIDPDLLDVLRLGAYQILYLDVPDYAAVSQAVELAPRRGAGFANAVLRAVGRAGEDAALFPRPETDLAGWLSTWGSHPRWLIDRWLARWPGDDVRELVRHDNEIPPLTLLPLRHDADEAVGMLAAAGMAAHPVGGGSRCVELAQGSDPRSALAALPAIVQDPGASLVIDYAVPRGGADDRSRKGQSPVRGPWVADLCAAPGGKALALAARGYRVLAADRSPARLRLLAENVARTGLPVVPVVALAERPPVRDAPLVLVDVPCTGTGTLRRHPDARWRLRPSDPAALAAVQDQILEGAAGAVSPGGALVYSTCTLESEENEERIDVFLQRHPELRLEPGGGAGGDHLDDAGRLAVRPWKSGFDGAFAALLRKR
jgi:16S rRNA (cytosine967-C5)-methyltransferase